MAGCFCFISQLGRRGRSSGGAAAAVRSPTGSETASYSSASSGDGYLSAAAGQHSPRGHLVGRHVTVTCEVVLMEHEGNDNELMLFVHKNLRPIRTKPEDRYKPLLGPLIQKSFTGADRPLGLGSFIAQERPSLEQAAGNGSSGARSITQLNV